MQKKSIETKKIVYNILWSYLFTNIRKTTHCSYIGHMCPQLLSAVVGR